MGRRAGTRRRIDRGGGFEQANVFSALVGIFAARAFSALAVAELIDNPALLDNWISSPDRDVQ